APQVRRAILFGVGKDLTYVNQPSVGGRYYRGIANDLMFIYRNTTSESIRTRYQRYLQTSTCPACDGQRLNPQARFIKLKTLSDRFSDQEAWCSIGQCCSMSIDQAVAFFSN
ncbi:MAG: hypothetical protein ACKOAH_24570, partial [Pirellula sp.]